jgi:hypothetical protein
MSEKISNAKRYVSAAVSVADRASGMWSAWIAANAAIVWGAQMLSSAPAMPPANDNGAAAPVAAGALVQPSAVVPLAAEPAAPQIALSPIALPAPSSDPSHAVWAYLCGRDEALSDATRTACPASAAPMAAAPAQTNSFDTYEKSTDPFAWNERLNADNDNHHIVQED